MFEELELDSVLGQVSVLGPKTQVLAFGAYGFEHMTRSSAWCIV